MVALLFEQAVTPNMPDVVEAIRARHPGAPVSIPKIPARKAKAAAPVILCGGEMVVVMTMAVPLPHDRLNINAAMTTWPLAAAAFGRHRGHILLSTLGPAENKLHAARAMTAVAGGLIAAVPGCLGVAVGARPVAYAADHWLQMSQAAFSPNFPCMLWIGIQPFHENSMVGAVTSGLAAFLGREIEYEPSGHDLKQVLSRVANLVAYLIARGPVVGDGHTIGSSAEEQATVKHATSRRFANLPVLLVTAAGK